jgi:hypothetical protein
VTNSALVAHRTKWVATLFNELNSIFEDAGTNIHIYESGYEIEPVNQAHIQADLSLYGPQGRTLELAVDLADRDGGWLHVLWLWTSDSAVSHVGDRGLRVVVLSDVPTGHTLAHEFAHALGIATHVYNDPTNLMNDGSIGSGLTSSQLQAMWSSVNSEDELTIMSCDK